MTTILIFGAAAGVFLGVRHFKVFALAPLIVLAAAGVVATGVATGLDRRNIILGLLAAIACPQLGYLISCIRPLTTRKQPHPDRKSRFTIGSRGQDLLLSNYNSDAYNPAAHASIALKATPRSNQARQTW